MCLILLRTFITVTYYGSVLLLFGPRALYVISAALLCVPLWEPTIGMLLKRPFNLFAKVLKWFSESSLNVSGRRGLLP